MSSDNGHSNGESPLPDPGLVGNSEPNNADEPRYRNADVLAKHAWKPGQSGNPKGRPAVPSFAGRLSKLYPLKAIERGWAAATARKLGLDPNVVTIGDLVAEASTLNAIRGRSNYLRESNERCEGKVPDQVQIDGGTQIVVMLMTGPPPDAWAKTVRQLIGHEPGDPALACEVEAAPATCDSSSNGNGHAP